MANYLLIESRDPYDSADAGPWGALAQELAAHGHPTTVYLVQNGVFPARRGARHNTLLTDLADAGVTVLADDFSLRERAIANLAEPVQAVPIERLLALLLTPDTRAIWH